MRQNLEISELNKDIKKKKLKIEYTFTSPKNIKKGSIVCQKIYESLINKLSKNLNKYHNVNWPVRSWKVLIGPFLSRLIETIYEKWLILNNLEKNHKNIILTGNQIANYDFSCFDFNDFTKKTHTKEWNEQLYLYIIKNYFSLHVKKVKKKTEKKKGTEETFNKKLIRHFFLSFISISLSFLKKKNDGIIYFSYIRGFWNKIKLYILLGQFPQIFLPTEINRNHFQKLIPQSHDRKNIFNFSKKKDFRYLINDLNSKIFPLIYLEGFKKLEKISDNLNFPKKPKFILTSASPIYKEEVFKLFLAKQIINSSKLLSIQHGGIYGTEYFEHSVPRHEIDITDNFLSWGWGKTSKIRKIPSPIILNCTQKYSSNGKILVVFTSVREQFSYFSTDSLWGERSEIYLRDQINFLSLIKKKLTNSFDVKMYPDTKFYQNKVSKEIDKLNKHKKIKKIFHTNNFNEFLSNYNLIIFNYNGTTFLESIGTNRPSMMLLNKTIMPHKKSKLFTDLKKVGILHYDKNSLIKKLSNIKGNIDGWWNSIEVINAKKNFCKMYVKKSDNYLKLYIGAINNL